MPPSRAFGCPTSSFRVWALGSHAKLPTLRSTSANSALSLFPIPFFLFSSAFNCQLSTFDSCLLPSPVNQTTHSDKPATNKMPARESLLLPPTRMATPNPLLNLTLQKSAKIFFFARF
jgi:hypothetical protein